MTLYKNSVTALLESLIDYAGLFPPASLPLDQAIVNYKKYKDSNDSWMMGPFIIPVARIEELDPYVYLFSSDSPLTISAIGSKSNNSYHSQELLQQDLEKLETFCHKHGDRIKIKLFEMPLPPELPKQELLEFISSETAKHGLDCFCEVILPINVDWERQINSTLDEICKHNAKLKPSLGFKLRTGGVTSDSFPKPAQLSSAIIGCRDRGIAMKFTAGLHHPIRMFREEVGTKMHGFLNVFSAGVMAHAHHLNKLRIEEILSDEEPGNFTLTDEGLIWRDLTVTALEIRNIRNQGLLSYGSCSFDEPRDELRALMLLERGK